VPAWRCILALLLEETGRSDAARKLLDELRRTTSRRSGATSSIPPRSRGSRGLVARQRDAARAKTLYALLEPFADRNIVVSLYSPGCLGSAQAYLGLLARRSATASARSASRSRRRRERAHGRASLRGSHAVLARRILGARNAPGDAERAAALVASARETAAACGMSVLLDEIAAAEAPPSGRRAAARRAVRRARRPDRGDAAPGRRVLERRCGADAFQLKDSKGLRFLQTLLQQPGREMHVLDLSAEPSEPGGRRPARPPRATPGSCSTARPRPRTSSGLEDLRDELEEAERFNDPARALRARREIDFLGEELARAVGLGGRDRRAAAAAERARVNVTRTIAAVLKRITAASPTLGQHLAATISTGYFCSYTPDPRVPFVWSF
jgi:hypothetical protein